MNFSVIDQIEVAYCAEDALAYAELYQIHILLTDIQMDKMSGLDLIERIKDYNPDIVSIVITAYAKFPYAHRAIQLGVKGFLLKPFGKEELSAALEKAIAAVKPEDIKIEVDNPIDQAKVYVQEHIDSDVNMAVIANELNLSYNYFSKLFRQETGKSFSAYVLETKMQTAKEMLQAGKNIAEISNYLGYGTQQNFSRAFSNYWGESPKNYRQKQT